MKAILEQNEVPVYWAPDGSVIAFMSEADGAIHNVRPSGGDDTLISSPVEEGEISELDWQPR
jgi:hypothetical protein